MLRFLSATLFDGGSTALSRKTSWMRTASLLRRPASPGAAYGLPSRKILVPMSLRPSSSCPPAAKMALNESMWGSTASRSAGYAVLSLGGFEKRSWRRLVSKAVVHGFGCALLALGGAMAATWAWAAGVKRHGMRDSGAASRCAGAHLTRRGLLRCRCCARRGILSRTSRTFSVGPLARHWPVPMSPARAA
jgi:hypothetical protein